MQQSTSDLDFHDLYAMIATELFASSKEACDRRIGLELELFAFARGENGRLERLAVTGEKGVRAWLTEVATAQGWSLAEREGADLAIRVDSSGSITLEPAGQIEYSGPPYGEVERALADLDRIVSILERHAAAFDIELRTIGYNSILPESEHRLAITKPRYQAMDRYFAAVGPFGRRMMRATCALQINLDFGDRSEAPECWRLANMISPSLNAIFANSPLTIDGRHYHSYRYEIWRHVDPTRTGRLFDRPDLDPIADYLRFALDAGVMLIVGEGGVATPPDRPLSFREWIAGSPGLRAPRIDDWRLHLSTLFPDVRARGYMEIRSIDALPAGARDVAVAMVSALIYDARLRAEAIRRLERRERTAEVGEPEHDGCWRSDLATGRELLEMAIPAMESERLRKLGMEYLEKLGAVD